ncbi:MAG: hypothetical protein MI784_12245 [Cytophagales bacterium]|nr:hypothetical protein [Cytophagales bacterium]
MNKKSTQIIAASIILGGLVGIGATTWYYLMKKEKGNCCHSFFDCFNTEKKTETKEKS